MYTLLIANKRYSSWSMRPWCLMKELGIPFDEKLYPFDSISFRTFSPNGKVPCLKSDELTIWDSLAIVEFLAERHTGVWSLDEAVRTWSRCATAEMHSDFLTLRKMCSMDCAITFRLREKPQILLNDINRIEEIWDEGLTRFGGPFLAGDKFSAVDAFYAPMAIRHQSYNIFTGVNALNYCQTLLALNSIKTWIREALAETWTDPEHDESCLQYAEVVEDLSKK